MHNRVSFYLNGELVELENPSPDLLLIDFLRSEEVGLIGAKKGCGQGGCGACTVIVSRREGEQGTVEHSSINSCLRPVCALGGTVITTVEGTGGVERPPPKHLTHTPTFFRTAAPAGSMPAPALVAAQNLVRSKREGLGELKSRMAEGRARLRANRKELLESLPSSGATGQAGRLIGRRGQDDPRGTRDPLAGRMRRLRRDDPERVARVDAEAQPTIPPDEGMNPVAYQLAINNGTQCGYCSVGFVMNMSAFLADNPHPTKQQIEDIFDGNICRCTGYRSILTGMKTFAVDWTEEDQAKAMKCITDDGCSTQRADDVVVIPFPDEAGEQVPVSAEGNGQIWLTPRTIQELRTLVHEHRGERVRLVHANTSFGVYPDEYTEAQVLLDLRLIPELRAWEHVHAAARFGAGTTYTEVIEALERVVDDDDEIDSTTLEAALYMARRTAGHIVRNAATLGGNTMMVLHHIQEGEPFPSDMLTALSAIDAEVLLLRLSNGKHARVKIDALVDRVLAYPEVADDVLLVEYHLPHGHTDDVVFAQKVALREVNSHSIVNCTTRLRVGEDLVVSHPALVYGGIAPYPWHAKKTEQAIAGKRLSLAILPELVAILQAEVTETLDKWASRMANEPNEGLTAEYRTQLAISFLYKAVVHALLLRAPAELPPAIASSGVDKWGRWGVSDGQQFYKNSVQGFRAPVSEPIIKLSAMYQTSGQIHYTHELTLPPDGVNLAFVQSPFALGKFHFQDPDGTKITAEQLCEHLAERFEEFVDLVTHEDVPSPPFNFQGIGGDQPLFSTGEVRYTGQSLALVAAMTEQDAITIADYVSDNCIGKEPIGWPAPFAEPILDLDAAISAGSIYPDYPSTAFFYSHIWKITRPGTRLDWITPDKDPLDKSFSCRNGNVDGHACLVVEGSQLVGGQAHFYMETQSCVVLPEDQGGFTVHPSTQSPMEMHQTVAMALGMEHNHINVQVRHVGGGYGGKTEQTRFVAGPAAVAAKALERPVRLVMPRDNDTAMIGKRHPYYAQFQVAVDTGASRREDRGLIRGFYNRMWGDGGAYYDCSYIVSNCIQLRVDNAYRIANFENELDVCRTNTAPNTAFRAFGDIQNKLITETAVDDAAVALDMDPADLRYMNMYERGDVTAFGQALTFCYMKDVWQYLREVSEYDAKRAKVAEFNAANRWRKQGIHMMPCKYGSGYNLVQLEQAMAVISVFSGDGSLVIHQGGVDMGQGITTVVTQVASYVLNVPMELIRVKGPETAITPNPSSTGASTGTPYSGEAVRQAAQKLRDRLVAFAAQLREDNGDDWCKDNGIDYWNYPEGWAKSIEFQGGTKLIWQNLVLQAYQNRVDLISSFTAPIAGGELPVPALTFKTVEQQVPIPGIEISTMATAGGVVDSFVGFTYSAACSIVELDVLTGEVKILKSDLMYDAGWSLNPAIDIGQVEGAFIQGVGYVLTEKLVYETDGPDTGRLNTTNTWRYKPPATTTIPLELNTHLFPRGRVKDVPENPYGLFSSKEIGEPPLVLAGSVFLALKEAIRASRVERGLSPHFRLDAPATVQEVRRACEVTLEDLAAE